MAKRFENPLLSDARLREMFVAMVEARALGTRMRRGRVRGIATGMEACWVGPGIGLRDGEGDFACAGDAVGGVLDRVLGLGLRAAIKGARSPLRLEADGLKAMERMWLAMGAAARMVGTKKVGLVYVGGAELSAAEWKQVLGEALKRESPLVWVCVPAKADEAGVAELASKVGVPGIPVEASDAVAMYRVAQESIGRARAGGGPALIEGVRFPPSSDPVALLHRQLVAKGVATERWVTAMEGTVPTRVETLS